MRPLPMMNLKRLSNPAGLLSVLFLIKKTLAGWSNPPAADARWPTKGWRTSSPEEQGLDSQKIAQMLAVIQKQNLDFHSFLIIRNGCLVSETYFGAYQQNTQHNLYSCTKSFTSTLIGIALDKGYIPRIDQPVVDFFPGYTFANLDGQKQSLTLEHVLTMRSGLDWDEGDPIYQEMRQSQDWVQYVLDKPMGSPPGSQFNYNSGGSHLLSAILQQATGMNPRDFAEQYLFQPLGISDAAWEANAAGIPVGGWGLQLAPREMAKLGYLYLRNGLWEGKQIVSAQWVKIATQHHTKTYDDMSLGYGYHWWTVPSLSAYEALGRYGQMILVIPGSDLVIVTTAGMENYDGTYQLIEQYIVPAA